MKAECEHGLDTRLPCGDCQKAYEEEAAPPSVPVEAVVRPWYEPTSRGYDVTGPDNDGDMCIEFDADTNIIWLTRRDVEMLLARWPNAALSGAANSRVH